MKKTTQVFTQEQINAVKSAFQIVVCSDFTDKEHREADKWMNDIMHVASMILVQATTFDIVTTGLVTKKSKVKPAVAKKSVAKTKKHARK